MIIILLLIQGLAFLVLLSTVVFLFLSIHDSILIRAPFVPIRKRALLPIIKALQLSSASVLYDLGCGDGRVLIACITSTEKMSGIGVERGIIPFLISSIRTVGLPIKIKYNNIFKIPLAEATHIFCYLSAPVMEKLEKKINNGCRIGTRVVSCDFQLPNWIPKEIISIAINNDKLAKKLFVYVKD